MQHTPNTPGRFAQYKRGDLAELFKPKPGDSRVGRLVGDHTFTSTDDDGNATEIPVLDLEDPSTGEPWSFRSSAWRWLDQLAAVDPPVGALVKIERYPDVGLSRDIRLTVVEEHQPGTQSPDIPF